MQSFARLLSISALLAAGSTALQAAVSLAPLFTDHAVLQRGQPIPVWGNADAGEMISVSFNGQSKQIAAGTDGKWLVKLDPTPAGGPYELKVASTNTITLSDILVGEVWVCSGQSNMEWTVKKSRDSEQEIAAAKFPLIRHFAVERAVSDVPLTTCKGTWTVCSPETVGDYTAVGYFFARKLHQELNVPIGLLHASWGGTPAEAWTSASALTGTTTFKDVMSAWDKRMEGYPAELENHKTELAKWEVAAKAAQAEGKPKPEKPRAPHGPNSPHKPASLYNGMLTPMVPYGIMGALWYQGESNVGRAANYQELLSLMITNWRQEFGQGDFPFYVVQLANHKARSPEPVESKWAHLREAQYLTTVALKNSGLATIIDIGEEKDIHPKNKQDVGLRLAFIALAKDYGKQVVHSGPVYKALTIDGANAVLSFDHLGGGLVAKGDKLTGFAIAGEDKKFVWADAKIVDDTVVVAAASVTNPVAVRYAWADNPECNLYNKADLPAVPFRTDRP